MSRLTLVVSLVVLVAGLARAQEAGFSAADQAQIDQIEAQLTMQGLPADIGAATDGQIALATGQLVNPSRSPSELTALMRAAVLTRPSAVEAILREATGAAADHDFSTQTIGLMLAAAVGALQDLGVAYDLDSLIAIVAQATGLSESVVAATAAEAFFEDDVIEENPAQDASPS